MMAIPSQRVQEITDFNAGVRPRIGLDTNCVKYYLESPPVQPWADCLDPIIQAGLDGRAELYVSTVVVSELLSQAYNAARDEAGFDPELHLMSIIERHFRILDVTEGVARAAGRLRGNYTPGGRITMETADALIGATSLSDGHTLFITNDTQLADALPGDACIYLRDLALEWLDQNFLARCVPDPTPVPMRRRGAGILNGATLATLDLSSIKPKATSRWDRLLFDAFYAAATLNEPCIFLVLTVAGRRGEEAEEVLFWHQGLSGSRPVGKILWRLQKHLGYDPRRPTPTIHSDRSVHAFYFTSRDRERARQARPGYASKTAGQREHEAWRDYLSLFWQFKDVLALPQTECLLCEDGVAHRLDSAATLNFINEAKNVLGWKDTR